MTEPTMTSEEFDEYFDDGGDTTPFIKEGAIRHPGRDDRRVNLNMPAWLVDAVDAKARHMGANRQSYINMTLAESVK